MTPGEEAPGAGADAGEKEKDEKPASAPAPGPKGKSDDTSADVAAKGKTRREIDLEKKVSEQEDTIHTLNTRLSDVEKFVTATQGRKPATGKKSFWDEVTDFVCPGESPAPESKPSPGS